MKKEVNEKNTFIFSISIIYYSMISINIFGILISLSYILQQKNFINVIITTIIVGIMSGIFLRCRDFIKEKSLYREQYIVACIIFILGVVIPLVFFEQIYDILGLSLNI